MNQKFRGSTPMTWRGRPSMMMLRPIMEASAPNLSRHKPYASIAVSGAPGAASAAEKSRPSKGCTPTISRTSEVSSRLRTCSGSARPVRLLEFSLHTPMDWKERDCSP
jgi:hypothetical protein